jgi:hypothetical protein
MRTFLATLLALAAIISSGERPLIAQHPTARKLPDVETLKEMTARFAPSNIVAPVRQLAESERQALAKLVEAARVMDGLFLQQVWGGNTSMLVELASDTTPLGRARLQYFLINKGPWSRLDHNAVFVPGAPTKPASANYYPAGATKEQVERWIATLPEEQRRAATGFFTTIRRNPDGTLTTVPYSVEYQGSLQHAADLLREAAALTRQPTLKRFLELRADAFLTDDYYASDVAWMELDASIEPTIGPYEVYEDEWFNYKAAFEAFITLRDDAETDRLKVFNEHLQELENHLPIDPKLRNPKLGALAPLRVVNLVFASGEGNSGVQTAAFNLPNDERVVREKGTKRVMLKNTQEAKFTTVLVPISKIALPAQDQPRVSFDAFFTHIVMHEVMHGLGPHNITVDGRQTTVRQELKELYSAIEEAKADVAGLWALQYLAGRDVIDRRLADDLHTTFLASAFRSIRFGINEAHGRGVALQLNTFLDQGAVKVGSDGTFAVDRAKIADAVTSLTGEIMTLEANGDYARAKAWLDRMATIRPEVQKVLDRLAGVPVDIEPRFVTAEELAR